MINIHCLEFVKVGKTYKSNHGGKWFHIYFKDNDNGKSYRTTLYENMRNFHNWKKIVDSATRGDYIDNLKFKLYKGKKIVDADSHPKLISQDDILEIEKSIFENYLGI
tara:strand:+ start:314 stop:637 length:324 start_codon:yes stop_codon:yes gene_type:complete